MSEFPQLKLGLVATAYQPETIAQEEMDDNGEFPVYGANGVIGRYTRYNHIDAEIAVACRGATCGTLNLTQAKSWINGNAMVVRARESHMDKLFLQHVLTAADYKFTITGSAQPQITRENLYKLNIPLPGLTTQRRIADYLDTEVGEMDAMVARLETLIADLEARRKAVITEMVATVDAPRLPMGMFSKFISGRDWSAVEATDGNYPVYGSGGVIGWANDYMYDGESIIFGRKGTLDKPRLAIGKYWVIDTAYIAIPNNDLDVGFFYYWATTLPYDFLSTQTALPSMTSADLKAQKIPLPDLDTQRRIAAELDEETAAIDGIIARSRTLIDDLKARKSALITEVVTGRKQV